MMKAGQIVRNLIAIEQALENKKKPPEQYLKGQKLKEFKDLFGPLLTSDEDVPQRGVNDPLSEQEIDNQSYKRLKGLAVFNFRALLNSGGRCGKHHRP